eukprot:jgi/Galph1/2222/GphlegSOOS_G917.1
MSRFFSRIGYKTEETASVWNIVLEQQIYCIVIFVIGVKAFQTPTLESQIEVFVCYANISLTLLRMPLLQLALLI